MKSDTKKKILLLMSMVFLIGTGGCGSGDTVSSTNARISDLEYRGKESVIPDNRSTDSFKYLNNIRRQVGLPVLSKNLSLERSAQRHSTYLVTNNLYTHIQESEFAVFSARTPLQRARMNGYEGEGVLENIYAGDVRGNVAIDILFSNIYHRLAFLDFGITEIGIAEVDYAKYRYKRVHTFEMGYGLSDTLAESGMPEYVQWPYPGQQDVSPVFYEEVPDPLPECSVSGYPVSLQFNTKDTAPYRLETFSLYDAKGNKIESVILDALHDPNYHFGSGVFALMPLQRLEWGEHYRVRAAFRDRRDEVLSLEWDFSTRKLPGEVVRVEDEEHVYYINSGTTSFLYIVPDNCNDRFDTYHYRYTPTLKIDTHMVDHNTIALTPHGRGRIEVTLDNGKRFLISVD